MSDEGQIKSIIERVQRLQEEKRTIEDDIKEVYAEARSNGYDVKVLRAVVKHLGKDMEEVAEFDAIFDLYLQSYHAADKSSRAHVARDAGARTRETAQRQNPSEGEVRSAVRAGAPESPEPDATPAGAVVAETSGATAGETAADARNVEATVEQRASTPILRKPYVLRPHCQKPDQCGSYGSKHCGECERLAKAAEDDGDATVIPALIRKTHSPSCGEPA